MTAEIPCIKCLIHFIGLINSVDSLLNLPKVFGGNIVTSTTEFTLEANTRWVEWDRVDIRLWRAASWGSVVVAVTKVASTVIKPATYRVDKACWVKFADAVSKDEFCVFDSWLAPAFVVYDLEHTYPLAAQPTTMSTN